MLDFLRHPDVHPHPWVELLWEDHDSPDSFTAARSPEWWTPLGALAPALAGALSGGEAGGAQESDPLRLKLAVACVWAAYLRPTPALQRAAAPLLPALDAARSRGGAVAAAHARTGFTDWIGVSLKSDGYTQLVRGRDALRPDSARAAAPTSEVETQAARGSVAAGWEVLNGFYRPCPPPSLAPPWTGGEGRGGRLQGGLAPCFEARGALYSASAWTPGGGEACYRAVVARHGDAQLPPSDAPGATAPFSLPAEEVPFAGPPSNIVACAVQAARALADIRAAADFGAGFDAWGVARPRACGDLLRALRLSSASGLAARMVGVLEDLGPCGQGLAGWAGAGGNATGAGAGVGQGDRAAAAALLERVDGEPPGDAAPLLVFLASDLPALPALAQHTPSLAGRILTSHGALCPATRARLGCSRRRVRTKRDADRGRMFCEPAPLRPQASARWATSA